MITYKNYTLDHEPNDLLMNLPTGSIDTAENSLAEAPDWEDGALVEIEDQLEDQGVAVANLSEEYLQGLAEENVQEQLDTLVHVDAEGESLEEDWEVNLKEEQIFNLHN